MFMYLKYGISAAAILAAVSFAQAQTAEHNGEKSGTEGRETGHQAAPQRTEKRDEHTTQPGRGTPNETRRAAKGAPEGGQHEDKAETQKNAPGRERNTQNQDNRQRQSNAAGAAHGANGAVHEQRGGGRVNFHVSAPQRTELHNAVIHDSAIHVYHRGDVNFAVEVGERIPDSIEFFAPPPLFVQLDPEFQGYMIVVLDDEILVVDPDTREIVDVLPA